MGIMLSNVALMAQALQKNVCFDSILTVGHLNLYLAQDQIQSLARHFGRSVDASEFRNAVYADEFLKRFFDAKSVTSLDYSDYEHCDIVHDMNLPVDQQHHNSFDVVIDGGSLEHIFNFPVAIANCMQMVKPGGSLFLFTMANNHSGHGFYQFSPELFFRIFQPENGFSLQSVILEMHRFPGGELSRTTQCFSVVDPAAVKTRVGLVSKSPVMMMVHAIKTESVPLFSTYPIQSDYTFKYDQFPDQNPGAERATWVRSLRRLARRCFNTLPVGVINAINGRRQLWHYSFSNRQFYKPWKPI